VNPSWIILIIIQLLAGPPLDVQVDRAHGLPLWYDPGLLPEAVQALEAMKEDAFDDGIRLQVYSGYRSYQEQERALERETKGSGNQAVSYLAFPGHSEHQLGTAFDVVWPGLAVEMLEPRNLTLYTWLEANAHRFGFVISYPMKRSAQWPFTNRWMPVATEFIYEPWHLRYVGPEFAEAMIAQGYLDPDSSVLPQDFYRPWP
jgi:D-alanyl-D-alanine carboxypeptidase